MEKSTLPTNSSDDMEFSRDSEGAPIRRHFLYGKNRYKNQWRDIRDARLAEEAKANAGQICNTCKEETCMCRTETRIVNGREVTVAFIENSDKWLDDNCIYVPPNCGQVCDCGMIGSCNCGNESESDDDRMHYTKHRIVNRKTQK
tara:strand:+ start:255 stop:689 length:435 start_codon:yes stop_codon:yes gene_type:complete